MKRLFIFLLLVALVFIPVKLWADATYTSTTTPKACTVDYCSSGGVAVVDVQNGYTQRVDSDGAAHVQEKAQTIAISTSSLTTGELLKTGACRVGTITYGGPTSGSGDYVLIYDALTATGTAKFDISIGTAKTTFSLVIPGGAKFATGIFADGAPTAHASVLTITYDD